jgi:uncharacterized Zn finger protein
VVATRLSILAAETAEPERYRRGRGYARDGSVMEFSVAPGEITASVQGSERQPYLVRLTWSGSRTTAVPNRSQLLVRCSCPDDAVVCKHAVATLLVVADAVAASPEVLDRWRGGPVTEQATVVAESTGSSQPDPLAEFFGPRGPELFELPEWAPLVPSGRPDQPSALEAYALACLDGACATLASLFG